MDFSRAFWVVVEILVTTRDAVSSAEAREFTAGGKEIILCDVEGEIYALDGICTHEDLPLDGAELEDGFLECPWHGARYDACTGKVRALPATRPLKVYSVRVDAEGGVHVTFPD